MVTPTSIASLSADTGVFVGLVILFGAGVYFLPTIIGARRKVVNIGSVFAINLLLGWSLIGWAVALAMALRTNPPYAYREYWQGPVGGAVPHPGTHPLESLERLTALRDRGAIDEEEFSLLKSQALGREPEPEQPRRNRPSWLYWAIPLAVVVVAAVVVPLILVNHPTGNSSTNATNLTTPPQTIAVQPTAGPSSTPTTSTGSIGVTLPVVMCPTTFGVSETTVPLPSSMTVTIPPSLSGQLAVYSDALGSMKIFAPIGWQCSAGVGADGSTRVAAFPPGAQAPQSGPFMAQQGDAVVASETSACVGCREFQACPLFSTAASDMLRDYGETCPQTAPPQEAIDHLSATVVAFEDPPGIAGDGVPSGGSDPANGVMTYASGNDNGSWLETCTLPQGEHLVCTAALNTFVEWYGNL